jgi:NhaA family Na+:H+ antiporter
MRLTDTFTRFVKSGQFGGVLLIACTMVSLLLANSAVADAYHAIWYARIGPLTVEHWINDGLMAIFFLLIGLELERELYVGELSQLRNALLPTFAAVGGMAAPALIHFSLNASEFSRPGFGIPMATDIAFALAVLALLGPRVPTALKVFVVAFAVIDDLGAIVLIATVYTAEISLAWLAAALAIFAALVMLNRPLGVKALAPYLIGGVAMWYCILHAGIHASIAGVMLAFAIPFRARTPDGQSPSSRLEHWLHKPVSFLILPLFALANTGVTVDQYAIAQLGNLNSSGIALGLIIGKPLGVVAMCFIAVKCGVSGLPPEVRWPHIVGAGLLGGIGFTMSIFITNLAFAQQPALVSSSKLVVLLASLVAGVLGFLWLRLLPAKWKWGHS